MQTPLKEDELLLNLEGKGKTTMTRYIQPRKCHSGLRIVFKHHKTTVGHLKTKIQFIDFLHSFWSARPVSNNLNKILYAQLLETCIKI